MKLALTLRAADMLTTHAPVPVQAPLQPLNVDPTAARGVKVTVELIGMEALHTLPQSMPLGVDNTCPAPVPDLLTVSV